MTFLRYYGTASDGGGLPASGGARSDQGLPARRVKVRGHIGTVPFDIVESGTGH